VKVYEAIARAFVAEGVDTAFGVMGDAMLQWYASMAEAGVRMVGARHEAAALAMADGYVQSGGRLGVCGLTAGPGLAHGAVPLVGAARADLPLVVFAGDLPAAQRGNPAVFDQRRVAETFEAGFVAVSSPASALDDVHRAFYRARMDRRPVVLNAPTDVQAAEFPEPWSYRPTNGLPAVQRLGADPSLRGAVVDLIAASRRPVIVAGRGAMDSGAADALLALAARIGALVATTLPAKGWLDDDPFAVGLVGPLRSAVAEALFDQADLVLAFGCTLDRYAFTEGGLVFPEAKLVSVNVDPSARPPHTPADLHLVADARRAAREILLDLTERGVKQPGFRTEDVSGRLRAAVPSPSAGPPSAPLDQRDVMAVLEPHLGPDHEVVVGVGHFFAFPCTHLRRPRGGRFRFCYRSGSIGYALPTGIGCAAASPERTVVVIEGDGSLLQYVAEIDTAVRYGLRLLVVVMNDEALGAEYYKLRNSGFDPAHAVFPTPSFADVARAFGADGVVVRDGAELERALTHFDRHGGVYVVDVRVDRDAMNDMYRKFQRVGPNQVPHQREPSD
jgi:acetolactate synthase-1/2/3 large subunit